ALIGRETTQRQARGRKKGCKKKFPHRARRIQNRRKQWGRRPRVFQKARRFPPEPKKLPASRRRQLNRNRLPHQRRLPPPPLRPAKNRRLRRSRNPSQTYQRPWRVQKLQAPQTPVPNQRCFVFYTPS